MLLKEEFSAPGYSTLGDAVKCGASDKVFGLLRITDRWKHD